MGSVRVDHRRGNLQSDDQSPPPYESLYPGEPSSSESSHSNRGRSSDEDSCSVGEGVSVIIDAFSLCDETSDYYLNSDSAATVIKNQKRILRNESSSRLKSISVYHRDGIQEDEQSGFGSSLLSRSQRGATFVKTQYPSSNPCLEYLLLPPITLSDIVKSLHSWLRHHHIDHRIFSSSNIKDISTLYLWRYQLSTTSERRTTSHVELSSRDSSILPTTKQDLSDFSKWHLPIDRPADHHSITRVVPDCVYQMPCKRCSTNRALVEGQSFKTRCLKCNNRGTVPTQVQVTAHWKTMEDVYYSNVVDSNDQQCRLGIPKTFLMKSKGIAGYEDENKRGEVNAMKRNDWLEESMIKISNSFLQSHKELSKGERIVKQKHKIVCIPIYKVVCKKNQVWWIVGTNHQVFAPYRPCHSSQCSLL